MNTTRRRAMGDANLRVYKTVATLAHSYGSNAFNWGVLLPNDLILCIPQAPSSSIYNLGLYNPANNTFTQGPLPATTGTPTFSDAVLLPNGNVILVPANHTHVGKYDYTTNTYTDLVALPTGTGHTGTFEGGVLMQNGNIMFVPYSRTYIGIYNPTANTFTVGPSHGLANPNNGLFLSGALLPNGKVMLAPYFSPVVGIYDPATNTYSNGPAHNLGNYVYWSKCGLMPNGLVLMLPRNYGGAAGNTPLGLYDYTTNTFSTGIVAYESANRVMGVTVMPDGRITFGTKVGNQLYFYYPLTEVFAPVLTISSTYGGYGGSSQTQGSKCAVLDRNNNIILIPNSSDPFVRIS